MATKSKAAKKQKGQGGKTTKKKPAKKKAVPKAAAPPPPSKLTNADKMPKRLKPTKDPEELAKRLAVAVNRVAYKKGEVGNGWISYMQVSFHQLMKQGYTITDPEGKAIDVVLPPEPVANRKPCAEVALLFYTEDYIITPLAAKDDKAVKRWLKERGIKHEAKPNKKTHYWIPLKVWKDMDLDRDLRLNRGADYWLLEGWTCKGK